MQFSVWLAEKGILGILVPKLQWPLAIQGEMEYMHWEWGFIQVLQPRYCERYRAEIFMSQYMDLSIHRKQGNRHYLHGCQVSLRKIYKICITTSGRLCYDSLESEFVHVLKKELYNCAMKEWCNRHFMWHVILNWLILRFYYFKITRGEYPVTIRGSLEKNKTKFNMYERN